MHVSQSHWGNSYLQRWLPNKIFELLQYHLFHIAFCILPSKLYIFFGAIQKVQAAATRTGSFHGCIGMAFMSRFVSSQVGGASPFIGKIISCYASIHISYTSTYYLIISKMLAKLGIIIFPQFLRTNKKNSTKQVIGKNHPDGNKGFFCTPSDPKNRWISSTKSIREKNKWSNGWNQNPF